ncbi:MAG: DNA adenine methylase [Pseudoramibacter alactolyticus]|nr:DNA adenine methylase [Pseudoramibacter alactolyticus]
MDCIYIDPPYNNRNRNSNNTYLHRKYIYIYHNFKNIRNSYAVVPNFSILSCFGV